MNTHTAHALQQKIVPEQRMTGVKSTPSKNAEPTTMQSLSYDIKKILWALKDEFNAESNFQTYMPMINSMMEQVSADKPVILLYGNYNSGKSTLINVLTGQEQALVGDIPTTAQIQSYQWNDRILLDSPGVNAPIEHEQVTSKHLNDVDLVLFVIRSGDVDEIGIYQRIAEILQQRKQIFILLNCDSSQKEQVAAWQSRLCANLLTQLELAGVPEDRITQIPVMPVNLLSAEKAQVQNNIQMQDICGYTMFADKLTRWITEYSQQKAHLSGVIHRLETLIFKPILDSLKDSKDDSLHELNQAESALQHQHSTLKTQASLELQRIISLQRPSLYQYLRQPDAQVKIAHVIDELVRDMHAWLQSKLEQLPPDTLTAWADIGCDQTKDIQKNTDWLQTIRPYLNEKTIHTSIEGLKNIGLPWLKRLDSQTLKMLTKRLNVGIQILFGGYEIYSAHQQERQQQDAARKEALQLTQQVTAISDNLFHQLNEQLTTLFEGVFATEQQKLNQNRQHILAQSTSNARQYQRISSLYMQLQGLQEM